MFTELRVEKVFCCKNTRLTNHDKNKEWRQKLMKTMNQEQEERRLKTQLQHQQPLITWINFRVFLKSLKIYPDYLWCSLIIDFRERWSFPQVSQLINQWLRVPDAISDWERWMRSVSGRCCWDYRSIVHKDVLVYKYIVRLQDLYPVL